MTRKTNYQAIGEGAAAAGNKGARPRPTKTTDLGITTMRWFRAELAF